MSCKNKEHDSLKSIEKLLTNQHTARPGDIFMDSSNSQIIYRVLHPEDLQLHVPASSKVTKRGRPKKSLHEHASIEVTDDTSNVVPVKCCRTRSGRMSKPPVHILQESVQLTEECKQMEMKTRETEELEKINNTNPKIEKQVLQNVESKRNRNISGQYRCATCKKAYLGRLRMARHLQFNPDHVAPSFKKDLLTNTNLWSELIRKAQNAPKNLQTWTFCDQLATILNNARIVIPKLLKPVTDNAENAYQIDQLVLNALGLNGNYIIDTSVSFDDILTNTKISTDLTNDNNKVSVETIEDEMKTKEIQYNNVENNLLNLLNINETVTQMEQDIRNDENNCNKNLLNTGQTISSTKTNNETIDGDSSDQTNLLNLLNTTSQTSVASSDEVMNAVDQLVNERLTSLTGVTSCDVNDLENSSANHSHNLNLDLSLDMLSYHIN